jgi:hypothetical protein
MRKFTLLSVFAAAVALLFLSGAFFPTEAEQYVCHKTKDGKIERFVDDPSKCKKDESFILWPASPVEPVISGKTCTFADVCICDSGSILRAGGAHCVTGTGTQSYLSDSYPYYGTDPDKPIGWVARCYEVGYGYTAPSSIYIFCDIQE